MPATSAIRSAPTRVSLERALPDQPVVGLTNDRVTLRSDINRFAADGWTAGHIGIAWGYYMLSENWRWLWKPSERPALYADKVKKIVVLMTDGQFNTYYDGVPLTEKMGEQASQSMAAAVALCQNMKARRASIPASPSIPSLLTSTASEIGTSGSLSSIRFRPAPWAPAISSTRRMAPNCATPSQHRHRYPETPPGALSSGPKTNYSGLASGAVGEVAHNASPA